MMRKRFLHRGAALLLCLMMVLGTATTAFAYSDEGSEGSAVEVVETPTEAEAPSETETLVESVPTEEAQGQITPDGNLSLVDDLDFSDRAGLQFMTVTSKDGHVFYIVIDRTANSENVYFLNQVDAADLMSLMTDEQKTDYEKTQGTQKNEESKPAQEEPPAVSEQPQPTVQPDNKQDTGVNGVAMLGIFGVIGLVVVGAFYFLKIKPKKNGSTIDEDLEFYDDEEYENEDQEPTFAEDETDKEA